MNTCDFAPLFRSGIGFDRVARLAEKAGSATTSSYPPYDIEKIGRARDTAGPEAYAITVAVAGFSADELEVETAAGVLSIRGHKRRDDDAEDREVLHRGIATRDFVRRFQLDDSVKVTGARLADGLLRVELQRETPRAGAPRRIEIGRAA